MNSNTGNIFYNGGTKFYKRSTIFCNGRARKAETQAAKPDTGTISLYITSIYLFACDIFTNTGAAVKSSRQTAIFVDRFFVVVYDYLNTILIVGGKSAGEE
jgi:hypothetical protein